MSTTQPATALLEAISNGSVEIVDCTQPLSETTPVIQLLLPFAEHSRLSREEISRYDDRGPAWAWYTLTIGEHVGTHLDAPIHWVTGKDGADVGSLGPSQLVGPACVIDKTAETEADNGYLLTVAELEAWEADNGRVPDGAWVLLRTGWQSRAQDQDAFAPATPDRRRPGPTSRLHAGSASDDRKILGFGTETVGIDAGAAHSFDPPFPLHNFLLGAGRLGLTQLANLDKLPLTGALLVVSPLRLVGGTGSPSRVFRVVPKG